MIPNTAKIQTTLTAIDFILYIPLLIHNSQFIIMITDVNCGLSQQLTGLLVNLSTRQLPLSNTLI